MPPPTGSKRRKGAGRRRPRPSGAAGGVMRLIGLFLALILPFGGVTLAAIYPRFAEEAVGREIARLPLFAAGAGFEEQTVTLPLDLGLLLPAPFRRLLPVGGGMTGGLYIHPMATGCGDLCLAVPVKEEDGARIGREVRWLRAIG